MNKKLITHINPHLDDIAAIWLFKKFFPKWRDAQVEFISAEKGNNGLAEDENVVYLGVGRGKYDEHKSATVGQSAMSLVWEDIKNQNLAPKDELELKALDEMVRWNTLIDTARIDSWEFDDFNVESFIRSYQSSHEDSLKTVILGAEILERILPRVTKKFKGLEDWKDRIEFKSKWGKAVAIESANFDRHWAHKMGYQIVVSKNPKFGGLSITAPAKSDIDLKVVYDKLKELEPDSDWFLHQSKKMVICGDASAPESKKSKFSLDELINILKEV